MRIFALAIASYIPCRTGESCDLNDIQTVPALLSNDIRTCLQNQGVGQIKACLQTAAAGSTDPCKKCLLTSFDSPAIACIFNCDRKGTAKNGCTSCSSRAMTRIVSECFSPEVSGMLITQLSDVVGDLGSLLGNMTDPLKLHQQQTRCNIGDIASMLPRGQDHIQNSIACTNSLDLAADWSSCLPQVTGQGAPSICTDCVANTMNYAHISCYTSCHGGKKSSTDCYNCLHNSATVGIGRCMGNVSEPVTSPCSANDASFYYGTNGKGILLECLNTEKTASNVDRCLDAAFYGMSGNCLECLSSAPAWSSASDSTCTCSVDSSGTMNCDNACGTTWNEVSVNSCFDPNLLRRPNDTETVYSESSPSWSDVTPVCPITNITSMSVETSCGGTINSCISDSSECSQCVRSTSTTSETSCTSSACWEEVLATSAGSCLYRGFPLQAIDTSVTTTPKSSIQTSSYITLFVAILISIISLTA